MLKKIATDAKSVKKDVVTRRKFMRGTAVVGAAGVAAASTFAAPHIAKAATVMKVQAAWGGGISVSYTHLTLPTNREV